MRGQEQPLTPNTGVAQACFDIAAVRVSFPIAPDTTQVLGAAERPPQRKQTRHPAQSQPPPRTEPTASAPVSHLSRGRPAHGVGAREDVFEALVAEVSDQLSSPQALAERRWQAVTDQSAAVAGK